MKRIVFTRPDGGVSVVCPAPEYVAKFSSEQEALLAIKAKDVPTDAINVLECEEGVLPSRRFRDCWEQAGSAPPSVNMPKARTQRLNEIRKERKPRFEKADQDELAATRQGDQIKLLAIRAYKNQLANIPQVEQVNVDACLTPAQLESWNPTWPKDPSVL